MKKTILLATALYLTGQCFAQIQIDKPIQFTGSGSDARISGIKSVTAAEDGVSAQVIQNNNLVYAAATLNAGVYEIGLSPAVTALQTGQVFHFTANAANSGACSLKVNTTASAPVTKNFDQSLSANDIKAGQMVSVIYDGTNSRFQMISQLGNASGGGVSNLVYSLSAAPSTLSLALNTSGNATISGIYTSGALAPVLMSVSGVPSGVTYQLTPGGAYPSFNSTLSLNVSNSATPGTYPITVNSTGGASPQSTSFDLVVTPKYTLFRTAATYQGNVVGGLSGADAKCVARASASSIPNPSNYKALIGNSSTSMESRVSVDGSFYNVYGALIASSKADLFDNSIAPNNTSIILRDNGDPSNAQYVWTGANTNGSIAANTCGDWTVNSSAAAGLADGSNNNGYVFWTNRTCNNSYEIYCFGY